MILGTAIFFMMLFVISIAIEIIQNIEFQEKLNYQNAEIILSDIDKNNIINEFFKEEEFFKIKNKCENACKCENIMFIKYSSADDYFLNNYKEGYCNER